MIPANGRDREDLAAFLLGLRQQRIADQTILDKIETVPRRVFLPEGVENAYEDRTAPIDCGQTMFGAGFAVRLVAALEIDASHRVLEIGTGSGYVTGLMARLCAHVSSFERYRRLTEAASRRLKEVGVSNVSLFQEDGREGFAAGAPFDRVIVHATYPSTPRQYLDQLGNHGVVICGIGPEEGEQALVRLRKVGSRFEREDIGTVRYQPLAFGKSEVL